MTYDKAGKPYLIRGAMRRWFALNGSGEIVRPVGPMGPMRYGGGGGNGKINMNFWVMLLLAVFAWMLWTKYQEAIDRDDQDD